MMTIKAIQTQYKGYHFRSRLEARWAVFFDALGLEWEYEPEGFDLGDGVYYLPDFKVNYPDSGWEWFEVKGDLSKITDDECLKVFEFSKHRSLTILDGTPESKVYIQYCPAMHEQVEDEIERNKYYEQMGLIESISNNAKNLSICDVVSDLKGSDGNHVFGVALWCHKGRLWWDHNDDFFCYRDVKRMDIMQAGNIIRAVSKARSARFEHGHSGATL